MRTVSLLWLSLPLLGVLLVFAPSPAPSYSLAPASLPPMAGRSLLGPLHTLAADRMWLLSNRNSEYTPFKEEAQGDRLFAFARHYVTYDPLFTPALTYAVTYLSGVRGDVERSRELLERALSLYPDSKTILYLALVQESAYAPAPDDDYIAGLIRQYGVHSAIEPEMLRFLLWARSAKGRTAIALNDLRWLEKRAQTPAQKAQIREAISSLTVHP